jgi:hypothetical protein
MANSSDWVRETTSRNLSDWPIYDEFRVTKVLAKGESLEHARRLLCVWSYLHPL